MGEAIVVGQKLKLGDDAQQKMQRAIDDLMGPAIDQHETIREQAKLDIEWYDAKPRVQTRNRPFQNASNMVYPLIGTHCDALQARRFAALFPTKQIWNGSSPNEKIVNPVRDYVEFLNHEADNNAFDIRTPSSDALLRSCITGYGVLALQWGRRVRSRILPGQKKARSIQLKNGIHLFNVPIEQICWQPGRTIAESEYIIRWSFMTPGDLVRAAQAPEKGGAGWDKEAVSKLLKGGRPVAPLVADTLDMRDIRADGPEMFSTYEIIELSVEWPLMDGYGVAGPEEDQFLARPAITVYYERNTRIILHVMAYPFPLQSWGFYALCHKSQAMVTGSRGVAKELEHMQAGISTMLNQAVDAITWSNRILGMTNDPAMVGATFGDGLVYTTGGLDQTRFDLKPQPFVQPNLQLIQLLLAAAERKTGMSDPNFGRESRSGGHPAPATSTVALLKQGQTVLARTISFDKLEIARLGEDCLAMYQAFEAAQNGNRIERIVGAGDAARIMELMFPEDPINGQVGIDVRSATEGEDPETLFQRAVQVDQVLTNYYGFALQSVNVAIQATAAPPPFSALLLTAALQGLKAKTEQTLRILQSANVDDPETFLAAFSEAVERGTPVALQAVQQAATAGLAAAQQGQPGAPGAGPGGQQTGPAVPTDARGVPAAGAGPATGPGRPVR